MRYKRAGFSFVLLAITISSLSQGRQYLYYFDKDLNSTEKSKSVFNGIGVYENGLMELRLYNSLNKSLVFIEHYTDSSLQISDGFFQSYYTNASKEWEGNYIKGKEDGLWQRWDSSGLIIDSSVYTNGEKVMEIAIGHHKNGILDSIVVNDIKEDRLQKTYYDDSGKIVSEVSFAGQRGLEKIYKNGLIVRNDSVFTRAEIEASFPGGAGAWTRMIMTQIEKKQDEFTTKDYGTCLVKFIVGIDGKVTDVEATTMQGTKLAEIAVHAIREGPKWIPATQYGRPVRAYRIQPLSLMNPNP